MEELNKIIIERQRFLKEIIRIIEESESCSAKGSLRISTQNRVIRYYCREDPSERIGSYVDKNNIQLAKLLAQKNFNNKSLKAAKAELDFLEKTLNKYPKETVEGNYDKLSEKRKSLITPIIESDHDYIQSWLSKSISNNDHQNKITDFVSAKGEYVRSKSELIIANLLDSMNIPYKYECPLELEGYGTVYPDFTVLNIKSRTEIIWEHLGMMDKEDYLNKALRKIALYELNGYYVGERFLLSMETAEVPLNTRQITEMIRRHFCSN